MRENIIIKIKKIVIRLKLNKIFDTKTQIKSHKEIFKNILFKDIKKWYC
jgi:hypothetical protein